MANKMTSLKSMAGEAEAPAPFFPGVDPAAFAERIRLGQLDDNDERARVNGWLGGTQDDAELHAKISEATGGHDNVTPIQRLEPPAEPSVAALHPSITDTSLVSAKELARAEALHKAAKGE